MPAAAWQGPDIKNPKPETVRLIGFTAQGNYRTDVALAIIDAVQIEDMWQALDDESQTFDIYISMRLSPMTLASCFHLNHDMNGLEWRFVFPRYDDLPKNARPKCFGEYLALNKSVQIVDIENYDIDMACEFLDKAFDFSHHKNKPMIPRQPGGAKQSKP